MARVVLFRKGGLRSQRMPFIAGDIVSVATDDGKFGVMKILAVDDAGIHTRLYVQRFAERPRLADISELSTAPFGPENGNPLSIGHLPLTHDGFAIWQPEVITNRLVREEELMGYRMWQKAQGGYF